MHGIYGTNRFQFNSINYMLQIDCGHDIHLHIMYRAHAPLQGRLNKSSEESKQGSTAY